ncbi:MAG: hypothetical protein OXB98_06420 [Bryobacterales bacterium]|nr:hypothetical protein [Bryobacterales bacterium]
MKRPIDVRLAVVAVLAGFLGSVLPDIALPEHALAQSEPARQVTAQEFRVVDSEGRVLALIGGASLRLGEEDANQVLPFSEGRIQLFDSGGRIVWSAPQPLVHPAASGGTQSGLRSTVSIPE